MLPPACPAGTDPGRKEIKLVEKENYLEKKEATSG
jgi:hypothetical protein